MLDKNSLKYVVFLSIIITNFSYCLYSCTNSSRDSILYVIYARMLSLPLHGLAARTSFVAIVYGRLSLSRIRRRLFVRFVGRKWRRLE